MGRSGFDNRPAGESQQVQGWSAPITVGKSIFDFYDQQPDTTISVSTQIPSVLDGPMVVRRYKSLTMANAGAPLTTTNRCRGLMLLIDGNLTINSGGQIHMTGKGARGHAGMGSYDLVIPDMVGLSSSKIAKRDVLKRIRESGYAICDRWMWDEWGKIDGVSATDWNGGTVLLTATGCGARPTAPVNAIGAAGTNGGTGAGGNGGQANFPFTRNGSGRPWGGGAGGPGGNPAGAAYLCDVPYADDFGGEGGGSKSLSTGAGAGAGNPGGPINGVMTAAQDGTGGILFIVCKGNVIVNSGGIISADGKNGGSNATAGNGCGGGGSGGGHVSIITLGTYTNNGTVRANGGSGGTGTLAQGFAGGAGSVVTKTFAQMGWV